MWSMYEIFEDCVMDIDLAIDKAKEFGYKKLFCWDIVTVVIN